LGAAKIVGAVVTGKRTQLAIPNRNHGWRKHFETGGTEQCCKLKKQFFLVCTPTCGHSGVRINRKLSHQKLSDKFVGARRQFGGSCRSALSV